MANSYDNIPVYHPNGKLMFFGSEKKVRFYTKNNLADHTEDGGIILTFEPKGFGEDDKYLKPRKNRCVVTGNTDKLNKHHIVPYQYRKHLPDQYKNKNCHDLVLIDLETHADYEREADALKEELIDIYVPQDKVLFNFNLDRVKKIYNTMVRHQDEIPLERYKKMSEELNSILNEMDLTEEDVPNIEKINLTKIVIEEIGVEELILLWKRHFIEHTSPKFLPDWWNVNEVKIVDQR